METTIVYINVKSNLTKQVRFPSHLSLSDLKSSLAIRSLQKGCEATGPEANCCCSRARSVRASSGSKV